MRNNKIPDNFVGDTHLTNWFKKHLGMENLEKVFINPESFTRDQLTSDKVSIYDGCVMYLQLKNHVVVIYGQDIGLYEL